MATLAPITTPARQPFGILNESKLRSLQSVKNRQNAISSNSAPTSLKRRAPSPEAEGGSDSENVDPSILDSLHKRKRSAFDEDVSLAKTHRFSLNVTTLPPTKPRFSTTVASTPRLNTFVKPSTTPASAPAAGRSPTRQRSGLLQPRKRFNPPPFASATQSPSLSLSAALNGTKKSRAHSRKVHKGTTIETSKPKSWFFDIYEETEEAQDYRMNEWTMTQSATGLEISDDESKSLHKKSSSADRGKENIDPNEVTAPVTRSMAAAAAAATQKTKEKEGKMNDNDEARSPLADLNPAEFYAEGLDATSVVLVQDDDEEAETDVEGEETKPPHDFTFQPSATTTSRASSLSSTAKVVEHLNAPSLAEILSSATPNPLGDVFLDKARAPGHAFADADGDVEIEIWESESAQDEDEKADLQLPQLENAVDPGSPCSSVGDQNVFALQEL